MRAWNIFSCHYSLFEAQCLIPWANLITFSFLEIQKEQQFHSYKSTSWKAKVGNKIYTKMNITYNARVCFIYFFRFQKKNIYVVEIYNLCYRPLVLLWTLNFWTFCQASLLFTGMICLMLKFSLFAETRSAWGFPAVFRKQE